MAAHRYWRATAFEAYGGADLELSEFHLLAGGVRVDATATLTASVAPDVSGSLATIQDDVLTTSARWSAQAVKGLTLQWDFGGSTADVDDIRLAGESEWRFPLIVKIQWSDNGVAWFDLQVIPGIPWPGKSAYVSSLIGGVTTATALLGFSGSDGSTTFADEAGTIWTAHGTAKISTDRSKFSTTSGKFDGAGYISAAHKPEFSLVSGDFTIELWVWVAAYTSGNHSIVNKDGVAGASYAQYDLGITNTGRLTAFLGNGNGVSPTGSSYTGSDVIPIAAWRHLALVVYGSTCFGFLDGVVEWSAPAATMYDGGKPLLVGYQTGQPSAAYFNGYIAGFQLLRGTAKYTSEFTPSASAFQNAYRQLNRAQGRVAASDQYSLGGGVPIAYGDTKIAPADYLSVESGSVKDQITGVLGEGIGRVRGTVALAIKNNPDQPVHRKVRLIRDRDGLVIREAWSDAVTGEYDFQYVDEAQRFTVVSYDYTLAKRAVIADNQIPELMP